MKKRIFELLIVMFTVLILVNSCGNKVDSVSTSESESVEDNEADILATFKLGEKYLSELDFDNALIAFMSVIEIEPAYGPAYVGAARAYVGKEEYQPAIDILKQGDEFINIEELNGETVILSGESLYVGTVERGIKNGQGKIITVYEDGGIDIIEGYWNNGEIEGQITLEYIYHHENKDPNLNYCLRAIHTVGIKDGKYEGPGTITWYMEDGAIHEWNITFEDGYTVPIDEENCAICNLCDANMLIWKEQMTVNF